MPTDARPGPAPAPARALFAWACLSAIIATLGVYCATRVDVDNDIGHFLPDGDGDGARAADLLQRLSSSESSRRMVLTIGGASPDVLADASIELARRLSSVPDLARVQHGADPDAQRELFELYFPHRFHLFSAEPERDYATLLTDSGLRAQAERLRSELAGVQGPLVRRIAQEDPLLAFMRVLNRLEGAREGGLRLRDGVFLSPDESHAVVFLETVEPALDAAAQRRVLAAIDSAFTLVNRAHGARLTLDQSGVNRYAAEAEASIRGDVQRISLVSTGGLLLLFVALFRSLRALLLVFSPPLVGMLAATAATQAVFGQVHGATLAFGTTLIGVSVDYPVHLLTHHMLGASGRAAHATLRGIWPALRLGAATTIAGLLGFGWSALPGIREMALFIGTGVLTALLVTRFALPHVLGPGGNAPMLLRRSAEHLGRATAAWLARPAISAGLLCVAVLLCAAGLPALRFQDDPAIWIAASPRLRAEDERVRARVLASEPGRIIVTSAREPEAALAANDSLAAVLGEAVTAGELDGFRSLHALIWSEALQHRNLQALERTPALRERLTRALDAAGFEASAFSPFFAALDDPPKPLGLGQLLDSALGPLTAAFVLDGGSDQALVTHLRGVRDAAALERRIARVPEAQYFDQHDFMRSAYASFRSRALELIALGLLAVFGIVVARYRRLRPSLAAVAPAVLAAGGALAVLGLLGVRIDLFHVMGLLLVLSMGEDYGVFLVESGGDVESLSATMLVLVIACASTVLSFGLLAMSEIPALRSLGQVISIGVLLALLWAPAGLSLRSARGARA